ncbi:MAG: glycosyltransferase family A protein [Candidatus Thorarchaeota archaeon]
MIGDFILITTFWNESSNMKDFIAHTAQQTPRPKCWLLIDDGSIDDSAEIAVKECENQGIPYLLYSMPKKVKGNFETIGHAYTRALNRYRDEIEKLNVNFIMKLDADTRLTPEYLDTIVGMLEKYPKIGAISGQIRGEGVRAKGPMGTAKAVRWSIARKIDEYWRGDPDTFWNIKSGQYGYWIVTIDDLLVDTTRPSQGFTRGGSQLLGRHYAYSHKHPFIVLYIGARMTIKKRFGIDFISEFLKEKLSDRKPCNDQYVRSTNSLSYQLVRKVYRLRLLKRTSVTKLKL